MVLIFGATGFTGRMTVKALVRRGIPVRAAARSHDKLERLADRYGIEIAVADVRDPSSLRSAAQGATALVSTVGPYMWHGQVAVNAAIEAGIPYFDCTGEPAFIRRIFDDFGPRAMAHNVPLITTVGYDYTPGTLAGGLALRDAGEAAASVDIGYFLTGGPRERSRESFSGGTLDSLEASSKATQFAWRGGKMVEEGAARRVLQFEVEGQQRTAVSIGASEHFTLPRSFPGLETVGVGLGWFEAKADQSEGASTNPADQNARPLSSDAPATASLAPTTQSVDTGPADEAREKARTYVVAVARDHSGHPLTQVDVTGPNPYDLTGELLAWAAGEAIAGRINGAGALGAIEAFGLEALEEGCATVGLTRVPANV